MQQETVRLAKQGDPSAIAALINQSLRPKGIVAKVVRKNDCLRILLDASPPPDQVASVRFVESGITKLEIPGITTLQILGRQMGQSLPAWNQIILLGDESEANPFHEEHPLVVAIQEAKPNFTIPNYTPPGNKAFGVVFGIFGLIGGIVFLAIPIIGLIEATLSPDAISPNSEPETT
ncbi:hypothetical protein [Leptolyngbya sp. FACHB-8]|uniref:hypothetical protein n=1 Tax=unclassified Leptolyngbya TaxID=2650499 RepID=UPI001682CC06|nr:hypothetical protein [Leptolyngbya sp. FACHB-8]MBD1911249.1 hypothetical protein [Leptolyngbya sp. FACHB-8]